MNKSKTHSKSPFRALAVFIFAGAAILISPLPLQKARAIDAQGNPFEEPLAKNQVRLLGQVGNTGAYTIGPNSTVLDVVGLAGGFGPTAKKAAVQVWRKNAAGTKEIKVIDCSEGRAEKSKEIPDGLFVVKPGDTIFVPDSSGGRVKSQRPADTLGKDQVRVLGQVDKPGVYAISPSSIVLDAIRLANSFTGAAKSNEVQIIRKNDLGVKQTFIVDCNAPPEEGNKGRLTGFFLIQPGDIIFVPEAPR